jgi:hypothetical protein
VYDLCGLTVAGLGSPLVGALLGEVTPLNVYLAPSTFTSFDSTLLESPEDLVDSVATREAKRSLAFNLGGLAEGLEKPLVGALLAGIFSLMSRLVLSTFACQENL